MDVLGCVEIEEMDPGLGTHILRILGDGQQSAFNYLDIGNVKQNQEDLIELLLGHLLALRSIGLRELVINDKQTGDIRLRHLRSCGQLLNQTSVKGRKSTVFHVIYSGV